MGSFLGGLGFFAAIAVIVFVFIRWFGAESFRQR